MERADNGVRRLPLRVAGVIGLVSAPGYLAFLLVGDETSALPRALLWLAVMVIAGLLAWFADKSPARGRQMGIVAAAFFLILGLVSNSLFAMVYLLAVALCVVGLAGTSGRGRTASA